MEMLAADMGLTSFTSMAFWRAMLFFAASSCCSSSYRKERSGEKRILPVSGVLCQYEIIVINQVTWLPLSAPAHWQGYPQRWPRIHWEVCLVIISLENCLYFIFSIHQIWFKNRLNFHILFNSFYVSLFIHFPLA